MTATQPVLTFDRWLQTKPSERRLRLFAVGCARHPAIWSLLTDKRSRQAVEVAERFADGLMAADSLMSAHEAAHLGMSVEERNRLFPSESIVRLCSWYSLTDPNEDWHDQIRQWLQNMKGVCPVVSILSCIAGPCVQACRECDGVGGNRRTLYCSTCGGSGLVERALSPLCGDVRRHPYMFWLEQPSCKLCDTILHWNDSTVQHIAQTIYDERRWERMPILADALLDAGCDNAEILQHCRADDSECDVCKGRGIVCTEESKHRIMNVMIKCKRCKGEGRLPAVRCRGNWCLDLILGLS